VDPLTMFPGLDFMTSYASFRTVTLEKTSKAFTYLPSSPCWSWERIISREARATVCDFYFVLS
jgi:hypothetical protein